MHAAAILYPILGLAAWTGHSCVDAYYSHITMAGARIAVPLGDRPYAMRDFRIVDPSGNELSFGEAHWTLKSRGIMGCFCCIFVRLPAKR